MKKLRDFQSRDENDKEWIIQNTWCDKCNQADLGQTDPIEFEENGVIYIEGKCTRCGEIIISEISED